MPNKHLFIDANVFVGFFELSNNSLTELEILVGAVKAGLTLWLPEQAKREFWRNREKHIKKHVLDFQSHSAIGAAPLLIKQSPRFEELKTHAKATDALRHEIADVVKSEVDKQSTHADKVIRQPFEASKPIDTDEDKIFNAAWRRAVCHLPPGKNDEIGDRLNWLALLTALPKTAELHIVSDDSDFRNEGFTNEIRPYLDYEWKTKNQGTVKLWPRISSFLVANFPGATNALEMERGILAQQLRDSNTFNETHEVIAALKKLDGFNLQHVHTIIDALLSNSQVRSICDDDDVKDFYTQFLNKHSSSVDSGVLAQVDFWLGTSYSTAAVKTASPTAVPPKVGAAK